MIDLAVREMTAAVMMTEAEEEMTGEILDEITAETSQETTDVAMTGITVLEDMTAEILMETMIGIVQNAIIPTLLEEWNVTDVVLQSQVVETLVVEIQTVEIPAEETSETGILDVEILAEETSETGIQGTGPGLEKRRFLQIMIGPAQSVTTPIFLSVKNVTGVASQRVVTRAEVTTEADEIVNQEMTGQSGMTESQENLERQEVNQQIMPTTGDRNRLMLVLEEEIAMIK